MKTILSFFLLLTAMNTRAQASLLVLEKKGDNIKTYSEGMEISIRTIYHQWFEGTITAMRNDSVYINGFPFHYKEIEALKKTRNALNYETDGLLLMIAGGGVLLLGAVNGLYRHDNAGTWYTPTSYITAGALLSGGYLLTRGRYRYYTLGKKYKLQFLAFDPNKKE
ncbi:MAG: hypothetical protein JST47_01615 [Bacteroidetes bacterium]|nr:hypothetical protein [Bacteroidota bacterium]MBS1973230.1 hypothetical protein [Bacteroidota bacterium]